MNILIENYFLFPEINATDKWNIRKTNTIDKKKYKNAKNDTNEFILSYGVTLERAIDIVVKDKCADKNETVTLMEYIKIYNSIYRLFLAEINNLMKKE